MKPKIMKTRSLRTLVISVIIGPLALAGCDTGTNPGIETRYDDTGRTYKFNAGGSYEFKSGDAIIAGGSYLVKDNSLFFLRDYNYGGPDAVAAAVERFTFTADDTAHTVSLTSPLGTTTYSLDHSGVPARNAGDSLKGKKWKSGLNSDDMWNVWDFKNDGAFQYVHHHTETNAKDVGLFSYFIHGGYLVTVAPREKNTEMGPSFEPYQVSAYSYTAFGAGFAGFKVTSAPLGGGSTYTIIHEDAGFHDESAHSYEFAADGTYKYDGNSAGNYLIRNNALVLLPTGTYSDAEAARAAAQSYFFTVPADSKISLISGTETHAYTLSGAIPASIALSDSLAGKLWKLSASTSMWNWFGFRNNGTLHWYHYMSDRADYIDRGDFSYLRQSDYLLILSAFDSNTKTPALAPYTVAAYKVAANALTAASGNPTGAQASVGSPNFTGISDTANYKDSSGNALPPAHYDDGFTGGGGSGGGDDGGHDHDGM
ncbi:MAG: hypothetical protein LBD58_09670 [Treponema sp.]|jgi:hypothetical protein|nr:hypothetical protein [Treponema sp.]